MVIVKPTRCSVKYIYCLLASDLQCKQAVVASVVDVQCFSVSSSSGSLDIRRASSVLPIATDVSRKNSYFFASQKKQLNGLYLMKIW